MSTSLLSNIARVETPFIYLTIGKYTFGTYSKNNTNTNSLNRLLNKKIVYPNYMQSLTVNKVNGALNTYTINMVYPITHLDDPNLIDKAFSTISKSREIYVSYGDYSAPNFVFREEKAILTDIRSNVDVRNSTIKYVLTCTSSALLLSVGNFSFRKRVAKPSDVIKELLYDTKYGLQEVFSGMRDKSRVLQLGLIAADDKEVTIEARKQINIMEYLNYLVSNMVGQSNTNVQLLNNTRYYLNIIDDTSGELGGPYFKVTKVESSIATAESPTTYVLDIGSMSKDMIIDFTISDNQAYSILYDYSEDIKLTNYNYRINDDGELVSTYSPSIAQSRTLLKATESDKNWWTRVTQYPITATVTLKGLLRPAILMSYIKLNVLFFGVKHISSGTYIITKQMDTVDGNGYRTTLTLTRIKGDTIDY